MGIVQTNKPLCRMLIERSSNWLIQWRLQAVQLFNTGHNNKLLQVSCNDDLILDWNANLLAGNSLNLPGRFFNSQGVHMLNIQLYIE